MLTGTVNTPEEAANAVQVANQFVDDPTRVVNRMNIQSPTQVNLQVRIVEVARNVDRRLGIRWGASTGINPQHRLLRRRRGARGLHRHPQPRPRLASAST